MPVMSGVTRGSIRILREVEASPVNTHRSIRDALAWFEAARINWLSLTIFADVAADARADIVSSQRTTRNSLLMLQLTMMLILLG